MGLDTHADLVWISTVKVVGDEVSCGLPPTQDDLGRRLGWGSPAPGADVVASFAFTDPLPGQASRWAVRFVDGIPSAADPGEAELELRCDLFAGMRFLLAGLPAREAASRIALSGDVLLTGVVVGAAARPEVLEGHAWLRQALGVAERTRSWWEPVVSRLITQGDSRSLGS